MTFSLDRVVPWGRSFDEYRRMFDLNERCLRQKILGCADGPAAFNAELTRQGGRIVSCDPLYAASLDEIQARIAACFDSVIAQTERNLDGFVWSGAIGSVEQLGRVRRQAMDAFLADYPAGLRNGRYVTAELPTLPFPDKSFDLALCSHFLFLYDALGLEFHRLSIRSLLRVAHEVRIFPLRQLDRRRSPFVDVAIEEARAMGRSAEVIHVPYEFQKGANQMLVLGNSACP